ncbi:restriction endonuclease [Viridibacillus sp. YIM B01967]|uniref:Restriction endonuclease n=1 Tax=Viridibacillus soli TaxID=2798301 RepID=A0ABS1H430_9BACL|nr:restriction endonuclease [Viridibacillus soli]MBK3494167.1 restriction endonuclease [Viridibacillus soli]
MTENRCYIHKVKAAEVLVDDKIVVYCPKCAEANIHKIVMQEEKVLKSEELASLRKRRQIGMKELWKSVVLAFYIEILPLFIVFFTHSPKSILEYSSGVEEIYRNFIFQPIVLAIALCFIGLGGYFWFSATKSLKQLKNEEAILLKPFANETEIHEKFQTPSKVKQVNEFVNINKMKYDSNFFSNRKITQMSQYDFKLYIAKLLQKLNFENVRLTRDDSDFKVDIFADSPDGKVAFRCINNVNFINTDDVHKIAVEKVYYDCDISVLVTTSKVTADAKNLSDTLRVNLWNDQYLKEKIAFVENAQWVDHLQDFYDYSDQNLKKYTEHELRRLAQA